MTKVNLKKVLEPKERVIIVGLLSLIAFFTTLDIYEDLIEGASLWHVIPEFLIIFSTTITAILLYCKIAMIKKSRIEEANAQAKLASSEQRELKEKLGSLRSGIVEAISQQLKQWKLSEAE